MCPYCGVQLAKTPQRKTSCPYCGSPIFVKSTPENRERRLMTQAQAEEAEGAWELRAALKDAENVLAVVGRGDRHGELQGAIDADEVRRELTVMVAEVAASAAPAQMRKMAHLHLAATLARRGDENFCVHLRQAAHCELERIADTGLNVDLVDIMPGSDATVCLATARRSVPLHVARRESPIPNPDCPRGFGAIERGYCTCGYLVAKAWLDRH